MTASIPTPGRVARRLRPFGRRPPVRQPLERLPGFSVPATAVVTLTDPAAYRRHLLRHIAQARRRIVIVALYLQDDDAGRELLDALYAARAAHPALTVEVFVDWHRAQRGLIGAGGGEGNAAMYRAYAARLGEGVAVYGVPVQTRELFGVLHLKGSVIDDTVIYSGASLNDVYLAKHGRYRLDRYHLIDDRALADSMAAFVQRYFRGSDAVCRLDRPAAPSARELQGAIRRLRQRLQVARYELPPEPPGAGGIVVTPLVGFGRTGNALNDTLLALLRSARSRVVLFTPYFNLPRPMRAVLGQLLRRGCSVDIVVGDKTANDFYIPPDQPFRRIGLLPYLYEGNLRRFARGHQAQIASGQLNVYLWKHGDNSFHLKGVFVDDEYALLTGNNLNPRAWALDLENGLLLHDPDRLLRHQHQLEWNALLRHATRLEGYQGLDSARNYPVTVRRTLRRLNRVRLDRFLNRLL